MFLAKVVIYYARVAITLHENFYRNDIGKYRKKGDNFTSISDL